MKQNYFMLILARTALLPALIVLALTLSVCPVSCRSMEEGLAFIEGDFSIPEITEFKVLSDRSAEISFSKEAHVSGAEIFSADEEGMLQGSADISYPEEKKALLSFPEATTTGAEYVIEGTVTDSTGNSLTFSIPFKGFNKNPARLIITEVRNAYGTRTINKQKVHRSEFVELYVLRSGNLSGIEVLSASDGEKKKYSLPAIEVKKGGCITVHMRTVQAEGIDGEGMVSETGDNLALSTHEDSCDTARDLWSENTSAVFADSDIVFLKNSADNTIMDAVLFAKSDCAEWKSSSKTIAGQISQSGIWQNGTEPQDAVCSDSITSSAATRSISRTNVQEAINAYEKNETVPNSKEKWIIAKAATPGYKNSSTAYKK